jgi:hypothetical protein
MSGSWDLFIRAVLFNRVFEDLSRKYAPGTQNSPENELFVTMLQHKHPTTRKFLERCITRQQHNVYFRVRRPLL